MKNRVAFKNMPGALYIIETVFIKIRLGKTGYDLTRSPANTGVNGHHEYLAISEGCKGLLWEADVLRSAFTSIYRLYSQ